MNSQIAKVVGLSPTATFITIILLIIVVIWLTLGRNYGGYSKPSLSLGKVLGDDKETELKSLVETINSSQTV